MIVSYLTDNWNSRHYCCHVSSLSQYSLVIYKIDVFGDENVDRIMVRRQLSDLDQSNLSRAGSAGTRETPTVGDAASGGVQSRTERD